MEPTFELAGLEKAHTATTAVAKKYVFLRTLCETIFYFFELAEIKIGVPGAASRGRKNHLPGDNAQKVSLLGTPR
ncbi:MAG TPA: hypothetical protein PLU68_04795 [Thermotogota bacterium]|nr:hypothetical protein [Thermotogota bacterium]